MHLSWLPYYSFFLLHKSKGSFFVDLDKNEQKIYINVKPNLNHFLRICTISKYCQKSSFGPHSRGPGQKGTKNLFIFVQICHGLPWGPYLFWLDRSPVAPTPRKVLPPRVADMGTVGFTPLLYARLALREIAAGLYCCWDRSLHDLR